MHGMASLILVELPADPLPEPFHFVVHLPPELHELLDEVWLAVVRHLDGLMPVPLMRAVGWWARIHR